MSELADRLGALCRRLREAYDSIGHSHGRPYVYFVYPPEQERALRRLVDDELRSDSSISFLHLDVLSIVIGSTAGQEQKREALLNDPLKGPHAANSLLGIWARAINEAIEERLAAGPSAGRPVVVLRGLAALHPLGTPTGLMEALAEEEVRDQRTGRIVPIVLLVPGRRPPQTSRIYDFLGQEWLRKDFYRGEEA